MGRWFDSAEVQALREARIHALARLVEALFGDMSEVDCERLHRLWAEYQAARKMYMRAIGWEVDDDLGD